MATKLPAHKEPRSYEQILTEVIHDRDALEVVFTDHRRVACMGSGGALGHPKTFYTIGDKGYVECGYCDRVFVYDKERAGEEQHGLEERKALPGDGVTESATPRPGESLDA
ncbi:zinc-finger domain-containing protein [Parvularcula sp. ZS-1/3]|uniref:Zinc-finger domain-containing protein n=1 Tax=Parvularcula mediterranea TaxID=2732508 RepID=A0A7Y3RLQ3_9PROT|nr:zinc-finger domain-containing protein [Parvularcula mediterranea]NNU15851.1 zinc-finger domain-containing protein [Parvularcula mediterranea]